MPLTEEQFMKLGPEQRKKALEEMRLEDEFKALPSQDRKAINNLVKANKDEPLSQTEAAARGAAQGLAFGFADEIMAGLSAAGKSFIGKEEFQPTFEKALAEQRARDKLAAERFPKTFTGAEVAGAVGISLIPAVGVAGRGAKAATALGKASEGLRLATKFGSGVAEAQKGLKAAQVAAQAAPRFGAGIGRGVAGVAKAGAGGALTGLGKAEEKDLESALVGGTIGAGTGLAAAVAGPVARGLGKAAIKGRRVGAAILSGGKSEVARKALETIRKGLPADQAVATRLDALAQILEKPAGKIEQSALGFIDLLGEAFEKQGGAGLVATHVALLEDPQYQEFLDRIEKVRGE